MASNIQNMKEILGGLLNAFATNVGGGIVKQYQDQPSPQEIFSKLIVKASMLPQKQQLQQASQGTQQRLEQKGLKETDPLKEATLKEVVKLRKQQVNEAAQSGVSLEDILQQSQEMPSMKLEENNLNQILAGQMPMGQQGQVVQQPMVEQPSVPRAELSQASNPITRFIDAFISKDSRALAKEAKMLENELLRQQVEGRMPLQEGEKEKLNMLFVQNVLSKTGQSKLSESAAKTLASAKQGIEQTQILIDAFSQDPNLFKGFGGPTDPRSQQVKVIRNNLSDIIGRMRSGGAINEEELKTFRGFIPKQGPVSGWLESPETVIFKLKTLNRLMSDVANGIRTTEQSSDLVIKIQEAFKEGYSVAEISQKVGF